MDSKTSVALQWIAGILNEQNIPYRIGGGTAVHLYGSVRPINDIDISLSGTHFPTIIPLVKKYIVAGPKHYKNEKWDCTTLSLNYRGQDIDLTDADTLLMSSEKENKWISNKDIYERHPDVVKNVDGVRVTLMHPRVLIEYKQQLSGTQHLQDIAFLKEHIANTNPQLL